MGTTSAPSRVVPRELPATALALHVGTLFGLDLYGVDVVETPEGWVGIDINDFPTFGLVPGAVGLIATFILQVARRAETQRRHGLASAAPAWQTDTKSVQTKQPSRRHIPRRKRPT